MTKAYKHINNIKSTFKKNSVFHRARTLFFQTKKYFASIDSMWIIWGCIALVIGGIILLFGDRGENYSNTYTVSKKILEKDILLSGSLRTEKEASLSFVGSGRVSVINVKQGNIVQKGQLLVALDTRGVSSEISNARADLLKTEINSNRYKGGSKSVELEILREQLKQKNTELSQKKLSLNQSIIDARLSLLSGSLEARPGDNSNALFPPSIGGYYTTQEEGSYVIKVYASQATSGMSFNITGLESGTGEVQFYSFVPLGSRGLSVKFSPGISYVNSTWYVDVPNKRGGTYASHITAYNNAVRLHDNEILSLKQHISDLDLQLRKLEAGNKEELSIANADALSRRSNVSLLSSRYEERIIRAPFSGVVGSIDTDLGEVISGGKEIVKLISNEGFLMRVSVPELYVNQIKVGRTVDVNIDSVGGEPLSGMVSGFNVSETTIDGVKVYEASVTLDLKNNIEIKKLIRPGMSGYVSFKAGSPRAVISVPVIYTYNKMGKKYVSLIVGGELVEVEIIVGESGTNGDIEIISGLIEGDVISLPIK